MIQTDEFDDSLARERCESFATQIPDALKRLEEELPKRLRAENASAKSKLAKIYRLADQLMAHASPHVACREGCSSCCNMNVQITSHEADAIYAATGILPLPVSYSVKHEESRFNGVPCPFLQEQKCGIYEVRPLACRTHVSFYLNDYWCNPQRNLQHEAPLVKFSGLVESVNDIGTKKCIVIADIRDFFMPDALQSSAKAAKQST